MLSALLALAGLCGAQVVGTPILLPSGLVYDSAGNLYVAETGSHEVLKIAPGGALTVYAGTGVQGYAGDGGAATAALLDSPTGLAVSAAGDVYVADTHNHAVRKIAAATGVITTVAGTGVAGHGADGTLATKAMLHGPLAVAVDAAANLCIADTRNHMVRKVTAATGLITTLAGTGVQGYVGDGGAATAAQLDMPAGLALDSAGNLLIADAHNQRVRRVAAASGVITTVAGTGVAGFGGDGGQATGAGLHLPGGVTVDSAGNIYIADSTNHRVRRMDAATGVMTTVVGDGVQGFAGDGGQASGASLDTPRSVVLAGGLPTLSDSGNQRVRQVDSAAAIHTIVGDGIAPAGMLTLSAGAGIVYGAGSVTATLSGSAATGVVTFYDASGAIPQVIGAVALSGNIALLSTIYFAAGTHQVSATYAGDGTHAAAQSGALSFTIAQAPVTVTPAAVAMLYGQAVPGLSGTVNGVLAQDAGAVSVVYATAATGASHPGAYPITAALTGSAAGNYALTTASAAVTVSKAPTTVTLNVAGAPTFAVHVAPTTSGVATGAVGLLDGATSVGSGSLSGAGDAVVTAALSNGSHTLTATYAGDTNFLVGQSGPAIVSVGVGSAADFTLAVAGASSATVTAGTAAMFSFAVTPVNGSLSSPIQLTASGLPVGATASFNPAYVPPGAGATTVSLSLLTQKAGLGPLMHKTTPYVLATCLLLFWRKGRVRSSFVSRLQRSGSLVGRYLGLRRRLLCDGPSALEAGSGLCVGTGLLGCWMVVAGFVLGMVVGCGDRVNSSGALGGEATIKSYAVTVTGTATGTGGVVLQHSAVVTVVVQ